MSLSVDEWMEQVPMPQFGNDARLNLGQFAVPVFDTDYRNHLYMLAYDPRQNTGTGKNITP